MQVTQSDPPATWVIRYPLVITANRRLCLAAPAGTNSDFDGAVCMHTLGIHKCARVMLDLGHLIIDSNDH